MIRISAHTSSVAAACGDSSAPILRPARLGRIVEQRMHVVHVATIHNTFHAPPDRIYRVLKGVAEGHGGELEWADVVERSGDLLLCDFWTELKLPIGRRIRFRTQETVELDPPSALHYRHRSGPSRGLAETLTIRAITPHETRVIYRAVFPSHLRWFGRLFALFGKPVAHIFMYAHFRELRRSVERPPRPTGPVALASRQTRLRATGKRDGT